MATADELLRRMRFNRAWGLSDEGSCFGVTDPSRLRPTSYRPPLSDKHICPGCITVKHSCENEVQVYRMTETGLEKTRKVPCECTTCHPEPPKAA